jgi:Domain of unknown function (DUF4412)
MKFMAKSVVTLAAVCSFASPLLAAEGVLMIEQTVVGSAKRSSQVQLERERMRAEMTNATGETQVFVFDGPEQVLRIISPTRKIYTEMTKADVDRLGEQMATTLAAIKEKLGSLTPEQRAKMEAMMARVGGAGAATAAAKPEYRRAGSDKVGKWTCEKYEGFRNGEKVSEVCTVEAKALGLTMADFEVSKQVAAFFEKLMPPGMDQMVGIGSFEVQGFSGIPVRRVVYNGGKAQAIREVTDVRRENFPASSYDVPAGFQKQTAAGKK